MSKKRVIALLCLLVMVASCLAGCGGGSGGGGGDAADSHRTVVIRVLDVFQTQNPYENTGYSDAYVNNQVYETLFMTDNDGELRPVLAKDYEASEDALEYTVHLIEDAKFQNGEPFKASDVVFTYDYAKQFTAKTSNFDMVEKVEALDDYTVKFTLNRVDPLFLAYTGYMYILNEKFVNDNGGVISTVACGTGPYKLVEYDPAVHAVMTANEEYRKGAPDIKDIEIKYISDSSSALVSFESGAIDFMEIPSESVESIQSNDKYNTEYSQMMHTAIIALNTTVPPLDNKLVRQALTYGTDKENIIKIAYSGMAEVARIQAGTNCFGVDFSKATDFSYNPEKAKELLAEAGFPNGLDFADYGIHMDVIAGGYHEKVAQVWQKNMEDIGVKIELISTESPDEKADAGDYAIMNEGLSYRADFSFNKRHYTTGGSTNWSRISDPYIDEMFAKGDVETDPEKRKEIYRDLVAYIVDLCPSIPYMHRNKCYAWPKDIEIDQLYNDANRPYVCYEWHWAE
ncbi:MAG: ABC transporter substrate-binding protein [Firmicutes bacterium]|nr:ABC transporter substrate-binding protein [Eubacterium sp.]MBR2560331.1 ABC transporter substrate-binding protein [Bacillota bacterium]MBR3053064.1 ABC transporter substrate-binding protein [Bacillota bacterium]MBR3212371.1 ABC transporter substrate-binding protein [Bacillota bacterium]